MKEKSYQVKTKHAQLEKYTGTFEIKVNQDSYYKTWYASGVFGCGRNYENPEMAIRGLINASSTHIISINEVK